MRVSMLEGVRSEATSGEDARGAVDGRGGKGVDQGEWAPGRRVEGMTRAESAQSLDRMLAVVVDLWLCEPFHQPSESEGGLQAS
jgi:hypothetical protein